MSTGLGIMDEKKDTPGILSDVPQSFYFNAADGTVIKNVAELHAFLKKADDATFKHHVSEDRNDFANWVRDIIKDKQFAEELSGANSKTGMIWIVGKRLFVEEKKKSKDREEKVKKVMKAAKKKTAVVPKKTNTPNRKIDEILTKEKEICSKEEKINDATKDIKNIVEKVKNNAYGRFSAREFVQGIAIGLMLATIIFLAYLRSIS